MTELKFFNRKHSTRTKGRIAEDCRLNAKQLARIKHDLCHKGCCEYPVDYAKDLDGNTWYLEGDLMWKEEV